MSADPAEVPSARRTLRIEIAPKTIFMILGVVAALWIAFELQTVLIVLTVALVLVGTLDPMVAWFERHGLRRGRALCSSSSRSPRWSRASSS